MIQMVVIIQDKEMRRWVRKAAEGLPLKVAAECRTVKEAIDVFRQGNIKLVILDLFLGDSSGLDGIKSLKKMDDNLAFILLSRMSGRGLLDKAFRYGAGDVLEYPCKAETLRAVLQHRLDCLDNGMVVFHQS